jgi:hypothetical protein
MRKIMKTSGKFIFSIIFILLSYISIIGQDFTRQPAGTLSERVKKQVYPDNTYTVFIEQTIDYGTYIPSDTTAARVFCRSIWEFDKPTGLPAGSYAKKVELTFRGNSANNNSFIAGNAGAYSESLTLEQKWNLADNISTTTVLVGSNGSLYTAELNGFADIINNSTSSKIYIGFKPRNNTSNSDLVTLTDLELKITYEVRVNITADNNFTDNSGSSTHGQIGVSGYSGNQVAPFTFQKVAGQSVTLSAVTPQTDNQGYQEVWQPTTSFKSEWKKNGNPISNDQAYTFTAANDDYNATYQAQFRQMRVTTSGTLSANETWFTNVTLSGSGDVIVPAGVTLTILEGVTVNLNGKSIRSTGGTITNQGTITGLKAKLTYQTVLKGLFSNIETAISSAPSGYQVNIEPGTYSENVTVNSKNNLTISNRGNTYLTGNFTFYGCDNLEITGSAVYKNIGIYYCDYPRVITNIDGNSSGAGINIYYCTDFYQVHDINNCSTGLNVGSSSGNSSESNYNCTYCGISASGGSIVGAYNLSFCSPPTYDFMSNSSSVIESYNCYFASGHPVNYESGGGNVDVNNGTFCGYPKAAGNTGTPETQPTQVSSDDPVDAEFQTINASYFTLMNKNREDKGKGISDKSDFKSGLLNIIKDYKSFIKKYPQSSFSRAALTTAANSFRLLDDTENRKSFLNDIINDKELTSLKGAAEILMIDYYTAVKDLNGAISAADAFINNYKNDKELSGEGLLKKGIILLFEMNQPEKAADYFTEVINNYPGSPLVEFAKNGLELSGKEVKETPGENIADENNAFSADAYPNPFNPTTTISFNLPEAGRVAVKVYDIMGAEVITLLDGERAGGRQSVVWNSQNKSGSSVASGIYIYSITYKGQSISKKIMMMK